MVKYSANKCGVNKRQYGLENIFALHILCSTLGALKSSRLTVYVP